jgi:hypothetical protein
MRSTGTRGTGAYSIRRRWIPCAIFMVWWVSACDEAREEETRLFERAEAHYRHGDYDGAQSLYERFVRQHPQSPFVDVAAQRLRTIDRELDAIMGRRGAPAPIRVNPWAGFESPEPESLPIHIDPPRIQPLRGR